VKWLKIGLGLLTGLLTLVGFVILLLVIDPNQYKNNIIQIVNHTTGRPLSISGELKLTVFPNLGIQLEKVRLGNAKGFAETSFASAERLQVQIKWLPLFKARIEAERVILEGLNLWLTRKSDGRTNWEDLMKGGGSGNGGVTINELTLRHAKIEWNDAVYGYAEMALEVAMTSRFLNLSANILSKKLQGQIDLNSQLAWGKQFYQFKPMQITLNLARPYPLQATTTAQLEIDEKQQFLKLQEWQVQAFGSTLTGTLQASNILNKNMKLFGNLKIVGQPKWCQKVAAAINFQVTRSEAILQDLQVQIDDYALKSSQWRVNFPQQSLTTETIFLTAWGTHKASLQTQFESYSAQLKLTNLNFQLDDNKINFPKLQVDLAQSTFASDTFSMELAGIVLNGKLQGSLKPFQLKGEVIMPSVRLPAVLKHKLPVTQAAMQTRLEVTPQTAVLNDFQLQLDNYQLHSQKVYFNQIADQLTIQKLVIKLFGIVVHSDFQMSGVFKNREIQGNLKVDEFNPRQLLQRLGKAVSTADATVLSKLALTTKITSDGSKFIKLDNLNIRLDNSQLQGELRISEKPNVVFQVQVDNFDLDRYLSANKVNQPESRLPLQTLRDLKIRGTAKVAKFKVANVSMTGVELVLSETGVAIKP